MQYLLFEENGYNYNINPVTVQKFIDILLKILLNFEEVCGSALQADSIYLRVNALKIIFEITSDMPFNLVSRKSEILAKISIKIIFPLLNFN